MAPIKVITNRSEFNALAEHDLAVVDFNATWCGPCKAIAPHFEKLAAENPQVAFASVDSDLNPEISQQYRITAIPTFLFLNKGREVGRVQGANLQDIVSTLRRHLPLGKNDTSAGAAQAGGSATGSGGEPTYLKMIPRGFDSINDIIEMRSLEALNATAPKSPADLVSGVRGLFAKETFSSPASTTNIESDADSQLLFYVPFMNSTKIHSILIQSPVATDEEDEPKQRATKIKLWTNLPSILSFDDTSSIPAVHEADIDEPDAQGWSAVRLRYVRFQRVSSLVIFLEGEDEDEPTAVNRIVFVGEKGDKLDMGSLTKPEE